MGLSDQLQALTAFFPRENPCLRIKGRSARHKDRLRTLLRKSCLVKHHNMKAQGQAEFYVLVFLNSALDTGQ